MKNIFDVVYSGSCRLTAPFDLLAPRVVAGAQWGASSAATPHKLFILRKDL